MGYLWGELRQATTVIFSGNSYSLNIAWVTIRVAIT
jgi:hypothetical protein